nr:hypothetical protein [Tanacetum cinerariifolium]
PYTPTTVVVLAVPATDDSPVVPENTKVETPMNMSPKNKAHYESEKEAIHLILTGIGDEIYSTVDACKTAQEINKGKEVAKPITPPFKLDSEENSDPEQAQRDKDMQSLQTRENVGCLVVQQPEIQCFNCKEFGHFSKECRKSKRVKDFV